MHYKSACIGLLVGLGVGVIAVVVVLCCVLSRPRYQVSSVSSGAGRVLIVDRYTGKAHVIAPYPAKRVMVQEMEPPITTDTGRAN